MKALQCGLIVVALAGGHARAVPAQADLGVGIAAPLSDLGAKRSAGPFARAGIRIGDPKRVMQLRLDVDYAMMPGPLDPRDFSSRTGDVRTSSFATSLVMSTHRLTIAPFFTVGMAVHHLKVEQRPRPQAYGPATPGFRTGAGIRHSIGSVGFVLEASFNVMITDYATGKDFGGAAYMPLTLGITF